MLPNAHSETAGTFHSGLIYGAVSSAWWIGFLYCSLLNGPNIQVTHGIWNLNQCCPILLQSNWISCCCFCFLMVLALIRMETQDQGKTSSTYTNFWHSGVWFLQLLGLLGYQSFLWSTTLLMAGIQRSHQYQGQFHQMLDSGSINFLGSRDLCLLDWKRMTVPFMLTWPPFPSTQSFLWIICSTLIFYSYAVDSVVFYLHLGENKKKVLYKIMLM